MGPNNTPKKMSLKDLFDKCGKSDIHCRFVAKGYTSIDDLDGADIEQVMLDGSCGKLIAAKLIEEATIQNAKKWNTMPLKDFLEKCGKKNMFDCFDSKGFTSSEDFVNADIDDVMHDGKCGRTIAKKLIQEARRLGEKK